MRQEHLAPANQKKKKVRVAGIHTEWRARKGQRSSLGYGNRLKKRTPKEWCKEKRERVHNRYTETFLD